MDGGSSRVERVARDSYGRLVAHLASRFGLDTAEDALADAFASALEAWPRRGAPANPEAWLLVAARNRIIDRIRKERRETAALQRLHQAIDESYDLSEGGTPVPDERLGMLFACAHQSIAPRMRAPLMLQLVLGIDAARIASAFLIAPSTMSQRLVRAKRKVVEAGIPLRVPANDEFPSRLSGVLDAIYAAFSEGWGDPSGFDPRSRGLADEAIWLGHLVAEACPREPEALGLLALMLYAHARRDARRDASGAFVPLDMQDTDRWDRAMIAQAEALLHRASAFATGGRFQIEAAIQSAHAARIERGSSDWNAIADLYDVLLSITRSPVVALNRAVALSHVDGAEAGLRAIDRIDDERLREYQPYWAARGDLLLQLGDANGAIECFERAVGLSVDPVTRAYLLQRAAEATRGPHDSFRSRRR